MGPDMPVLVYRLMEYSLKYVLQTNIGDIKTVYCFREAGRLAGYEFAMNVLHLEQDFTDFFHELKTKMRELKIGNMDLEMYDQENGTITITIRNDLDCSGIEHENEALCRYDEGFLAGIMKAYSGDHYNFEEIDCWGHGNTLCRFKGSVIL